MRQHREHRKGLGEGLLQPWKKLQRHKTRQEAKNKEAWAEAYKASLAELIPVVLH